MDLVGHYSFSNLPSAEPFCVKEFIVTSNQFLTPLVCRPNRLFSLKAKVGEKTTFELYFNIFWATGARQFNYDMWNMRILNMYCYLLWKSAPQAAFDVNWISRSSSNCIIFWSPYFTLEYLITLQHLLNVHNEKLLLIWLAKKDILMVLNWLLSINLNAQLDWLLSICKIGVLQLDTL